MSDFADQGAALADFALQQQIAAARVPVAAGVPCECRECGEPSARLIGGCCAPSRDGRQH